MQSDDIEWEIMSSKMRWTIYGLQGFIINAHNNNISSKKTCMKPFIKLLSITLQFVCCFTLRSHVIVGAFQGENSQILDGVKEDEKSCVLLNVDNSNMA